MRIKMGEKTKYWVGFSRTAGIGPIRLRRLLDHYQGDIEAAWKAPAATLRAVGISQDAIESLLQTREKTDLDAAFDKIKSQGFGVETWESEGYPLRLREIDASPPILYTWGAFQPADRWAVAVVGTRKHTPYGESIAREIGSMLAANGVTVVSGLARGIDGIAHEGALEAGGRTIAVLGSGMDHVYPPEHRNLAEKISENGVVISDYPLGTRPEGKNFPPRNRIISGMALIVVVVEAGSSSGALITADFAAEQGREVFAVPGKIYSKASMGTHRLIQSGARLLISAEEILEALNLDLVARQEAVSEILPEDETERKIFKVLSSDPIHVNELRQRCDLPISTITASLAMLELKGRARQVGGMHYIRVREKSPEYRVE
jgi:DNA processing protein